MMESSILKSIKAMGVGLDDPTYTAFDEEIVSDINGAFMTLTQLGVGPASGFSITGAAEEWADFFGDQAANTEAVKQYIHLKTKLVFDPPSSSVAIEAMKERINELEWRLYSACNEYYKEDE